MTKKNNFPQENTEEFSPSDPILATVRERVKKVGNTRRTIDVRNIMNQSRVCNPRRNNRPKTFALLTTLDSLL